MPRITPNLWFDNQSLEAAEYYCSIFPNSKVTNVLHYTEAGPGEPGTILTVDFELDGEPFTAINGGPLFTFSEAISLLINTKDQAETDYYWEKLSADGEEGPCGWLKDKYGLSWQVWPEPAGAIMSDADPKRAAAATKAMFAMKKIVLSDLQAAADAA
jgi:predicted 3-demethylubiquinone-9 3-methyltransferase (glyoxalase superfamily)